MVLSRQPSTRAEPGDGEGVQAVEVWRGLGRNVLSVFPDVEHCNPPATHLSSWPAAVWLPLSNGWGLYCLPVAEREAPDSRQREYVCSQQRSTLSLAAPRSFAVGASALGNASSSAPKGKAAAATPNPHPTPSLLESHSSPLGLPPFLYTEWGASGQEKLTIQSLFLWQHLRGERGHLDRLSVDQSSAGVRGVEGRSQERGGLDLGEFTQL